MVRLQCRNAYQTVQNKCKPEKIYYSHVQGVVLKTLQNLQI